MDDHDLQNTIALLAHTLDTLRALLRDLPEWWTTQTEGENTWSVVDVVGYLIHGEKKDWVPRARIILRFGENEPFEAFDRLGHRQETQGKSLGQLLEEFAQLRAENLSALRLLNLGANDLTKRGRHPALGIVTLSELLATWVVHDLTHLHQISRILSHQYREAVGPWIKYLGVLQCTGHSCQ